MRQITKGALFGAGGAATTVAVADAFPYIVLLAAVLLVLAGALLSFVWAVVFAGSDDPTRRFERVIAALAQFTAPRSTTPPPAETAVTRSRDSPQDRDDP
jgi:hypothetical protein